MEVMNAQKEESEKDKPPPPPHAHAIPNPPATQLPISNTTATQIHHQQKTVNFQINGTLVAS